MKKILIFILSSIIIITTLSIFVGARNEDNYTYVIQFQETKKAYPIMNSEADAIGFLSYYQTNNLSYTYYNELGTETILYITINANGVVITYCSFTGDYPNLEYVLTPDTYDDVGFIYKNDNYYIVVWENGEVRIEENWENINEFGGYFDYEVSKDNMNNGYYVEFPAPPAPAPDNNNTIITPIIDSVGSFVLGFSGSFLTAFTSVFLTNGELNALSIFLLVMFGLTLGYGVIRWITGLFRKES